MRCIIYDECGSDGTIIHMHANGHIHTWTLTYASTCCWLRLSSKVELFKSNSLTDLSELVTSFGWGISCFFFNSEISEGRRPIFVLYHPVYQWANLINWKWNPSCTLLRWAIFPYTICRMVYFPQPTMWVLSYCARDMIVAHLLDENFVFYRDVYRLKNVLALPLAISFLI